MISKLFFLTLAGCVSAVVAASSAATGQKWIISYKKGTNAPTSGSISDNLEKHLKGKAEKKYANAIAATLTTDEVIALGNKSDILLEADVLVKPSGIQYNPLSWGLDRID